MYYDGANLNAVCGISRPGDMGFDIVHINLHKTFSQPHGGGGPGGGPIVVRDRLEPFLPVPQVVARRRHFRLDYDRPKSIGKVRGFTGPFGVFVRSYAFIRMWGPQLREMSEIAVLNANYLLARLRDATSSRSTGSACTSSCSARGLKREHGISALDVAKRLMDYGFHPPTVYFPLVVPEALMIEPTETEPKETLDAFCDAMLAIAREAAEEPELLKEAPHDRPVRRLDEVKAAKRAVVRYSSRSIRTLARSRARAAAARGAEGRMIRVWRIPFSTNVERVALALAHKGLAVEWVGVDPADRRRSVVAVSGQPLVPCSRTTDASSRTRRRSSNTWRSASRSRRSTRGRGARAEARCWSTGSTASGRGRRTSSTTL